MNEINRMRAAITRVYPGDSWKERVKNMKSNQIRAIYKDFDKKGYFKGVKPKSKEQQKRDREKKKQVPGQMSIFDF